MTSAIVDRIRALPREQRLALYRSLPPGLLGSQRYAPAFWARPEQLPPPPEQLATIEVLRGGRGAGKTQAATWLFNQEVISGRACRPRLIAATDAAVLATVINGPSGIRTWLPPHLRPWFTKSKGYAGTLTYPAHDGEHGRVPSVEVLCCSAQEPGQAIGQGCDLTLADDPAGWVESCGEQKASKTFLQARVSNREGRRPCLIVPTTKRGVSFLRRLLTPGGMKGVNIRSLGQTRDNANLSPNYIADTIADLEGDDWAAEELLDEDRDETPGAMWKRAWIDAHRVDAPPDLECVVVSVDPADDGKLDSDETGIVVVGRGTDGRLYVLADYTARWSADHWPAIVAWAAREHQADAIVAEMNRARSLVNRLLRLEAPNLPVIEVEATKGKATRAEPLVMLYRDGQVSHVRSGPQLSRPGHVWIKVPIFDPVTGRREEVDLEVARDKRRWVTLEDELCGWVRRGSRSPNGLDALVWGAWYLRPPDGAHWATHEPHAGIGGFGGRYEGHDPRYDVR